ncbi:MAG: hypothetical protein OEW00_05650 [candidate division Zixibacteria bacterium]|nr:hypothetical protein [candidate division Zixibacteria bacterium]
MRQIPVGYRGVRLWITILLIMLVGFNIVGFFISQSTHGKLTGTQQLWKYLESETFKVISASLVLPILLFLLESRFKIAETVEKYRSEQLRKDREDRREKRLECIDRTSEIWNQLHSLTTEVVYFRDHKDKERRTIEDILQGLQDFPCQAEDVVNMWYFRFPSVFQVKNLTGDDRTKSAEDLFLAFMNTLWNSAATVAIHIREQPDSRETTKLQNALDAIQGGIKTVAHHSILNVLKNAIHLEEPELPGDSREKARKAITAEMRRLDNWARELKKLEARSSVVLAGLESKEIEPIRDAFSEIVDWKRENPDKSVGSCESFPQFREIFDTLPEDSLFGSARYPYSIECVFGIARWLGLELVCQQAERAAQWPA